MKDKVLEELAGLTADLDNVRAAGAPDAAKAAIEQSLAEFDLKFAGILAPEAVAKLRAEHELGARRKYDAELAEKAAKFESGYTEFQRGLNTVITTLRQAPPEQNPQVDAMRELAALQRFQGRTHADILRTTSGRCRRLGPPPPGRDSGWESSELHNASRKIAPSGRSIFCSSRTLLILPCLRHILGLRYPSVDLYSC